MQFMQVQDVVELMRLEYAEMPGLRLTFWQAQRLRNLSEDLCKRALSALTQSGFLLRTAEGVYVRPNVAPPSVQWSGTSGLARCRAQPSAAPRNREKHGSRHGPHGLP